MWWVVITNVTIYRAPSSPLSPLPSPPLPSPPLLPSLPSPSQGHCDSKYHGQRKGVEVSGCFTGCRAGVSNGVGNATQCAQYCDQTVDQVLMRPDVFGAQALMDRGDRNANTLK